MSDPTSTTEQLLVKPQKTNATLWKCMVVIMLVIALTVFSYKVYMPEDFEEKLFDLGRPDARRAKVEKWSNDSTDHPPDDGPGNSSAVKTEGLGNRSSTRPSIVKGVTRIGRPTTRSPEEELESLRHELYRLIGISSYHLCANGSTVFGRTDGDGGYSVCVVGELKPRKNSCIVLSFGIGQDWSFDEAIAGYGCKVHSFDPSIGMDDHFHGPNVAFHNLGLGKENTDKNDKGWRMRNIMTVIEELNLADRVIDVIKCDAEGAEWPFLEDVLLNRVKVKQIILEIHSMKYIGMRNTRRDYLYMIRLFLLLRADGYKVWLSKRVYSCCTGYAPMMPVGVVEKCCYEVYMYNERYLTL